MGTKPTDNGREIPWLDNMVRPVVRLHPAPGPAGPTDSHLGGPMLWPRHEPWPQCDGAGHRGSLDLTDEQVRGLPTPFAAGVQLYRHDFPELPFPEGTDVLQVFLCPLVHDGHWGPDIRLVWRAAGQVTDPLADQPVPVLVDPMYAFRPCVFNPCRANEYPMMCDVPRELLYELEFAKADGFDHANHETWPCLGDATKIGGWTRWFASDPYDMDCPDCGATRVQLLALAAHEDECTGCDQPTGGHVGWEFIGGSGALNVLVCPKDVHHTMKLQIE
ncbi:hypothetical protein GCM10022267_27020 [Lentzea roselyniae]|uniref:DUF1963 domain-containing protein n=1 Tax=Lentzea roselyniae TaxID=531940 RepID=A0ABP7ASZ0_9PSEU